MVMLLWNDVEKFEYLTGVLPLTYGFYFSFLGVKKLAVITREVMGGSDAE